MKTIKKFALILCAAMMTLILGCCGGAEGAGAPAAPAQSGLMSTAEEIEKPVEMPQTSAQIEQEKKIEGCTVEANGYKIKVDSAVRGKDYSGNDIAIVRFLFTNNNQKSAAFWEIAKDTVSQNGVPTSNEGVIVEGNAFYTFTQQISGGQTIPVQYAYPVSDYDTPLDVTIAIYNYSSAATVKSASCSLTIE